MEDFDIKRGDNDKEFVTYAEGITKTRQNGLHVKYRLQQPKMFGTGTDRYPIRIFKLYIYKRPEGMQNNGPFYLAINYNYSLSNNWYKKSPMGENTINNLMLNMK